MKRSPTRSSTCLTLATLGCCLFAGCGGSSSGSSTKLASTTSPTTATSTSSSTTAGGSSLKVSTTPKFASPSSSDPVQSGVVQVAYRNITINPDTLRVKVGSTVRWTDYDSVEHNVTSQSGPQHFASKNFGEGKSFEVKLTRPGTIHYECTNHPATMNGTIEVLK
jgi:plastocyanin